MNQDQNTSTSVIKSVFTDLFLSFSFISRLPIRLPKINDFDDRIKRIPSYFSLVGYMPGAIYYLTALYEYSLLSKILGLAVGFYLFDLFHFDGLLDMFDGFLNQSSKERRLEIMSKGNVGPFAVFYGMLYVLAFYSLLSYSHPIDFFFSAIFGRQTMVFVLAFSKPAKDKGLGALFFPFKMINVPISLLFTLPLLCFSVPKFIVSLISSLIVAIIVSWVSRRKIGGVTGDVIGGSCLISQIFTLFALFYILK
ncbi:MAG TPA: adenosylcobinamide-GDP ribazoletransferase [Fervidobacterium sp.]|nr:adenosylcobinamide-GDP ribazoletransferase [Fervidobacterium sp.]HPT54636.1 adenosylcobinamide-GDP ribazoletransferase [Fervidobacterium sp.]HPZ17869.1 adenosylcobinamide-GDP ribazoletransferase [Fervidobacterium sp.]HQE48932.1 adenosylcobinamide-GDP ribazoletransferase [Fervidobacterium sp.]HUM42748.1 adenosylcobinamide-GDP ribazoletransferase [Fervidobacterium sp.]